MRQRSFLLTALCCASFAPSLPAAPLSEAERQELAGFQDLYVFDADFWNKEDERIAKTGGAVAKSDTRLTVKLADGQSKNIDFTPCDDSPGVKMDTSICSTYILLAYLKGQNGYLMAQAHYEWLTFHWIDSRSGRETKLDNMPIFSPDARHIATIDNDWFTSDDAGTISIYERQDDSWQLKHQEEIGFSSEEYYFLDGLGFIGWQDNELTLLKKFGERGGIPEGYKQPLNAIVKVRY